LPGTRPETRVIFCHVKLHKRSTNYQQTINKQTVKAKAVAEISKMGNLQDTFVVVMHGWQSEPTDGSKGG